MFARPRMMHAALQRTLGWGLVMACLALTLSPAQARTLEQIKQSKELRLCVAGSSIDYYRASGEDFARTLGVQPRTTVLSNWDEQFWDTQNRMNADTHEEPALLASGQCDLFPNDLHLTQWRQKKMQLVPYFTTRYVVIARPELRDILHRPEDLSGLTASVQAGTAYESWLNDFNRTLASDRAIIIHTAPTAQSIRDVAQDRADFSITAAESAFRWVRDDIQNLDLLFTLGEPTEVGWAISRNAEDLRAALQHYFFASLQPGSRMNLLWRHNYGISLAEYQLFSSSLDTHPQWQVFWRQWGLMLLTALAVLALSIWFWVRRLRKEINNHRLAAQALKESQFAMAAEVARGKAISALLMALQQAEDLPQLAQSVLIEIAHFLPIQQALLATIDPLLGVQAQAHYAGEGKSAEHTLKSFSNHAQGLIERCISTGLTVQVERPDPEYLHIRSGLGQCSPASLLLVPIKRANRVLAFIELATLQPLTKPMREFLDEAEPIISVALARFQLSPAGEDAPCNAYDSPPEMPSR